uniref:Uncharacterized protein n=1 Tax=Ciona savignyi TaxID=51511 RepID=H2Z8L9_CIOSA
VGRVVVGVGWVGVAVECFRLALGSLGFECKCSAVGTIACGGIGRSGQLASGWVRLLRCSFAGGSSGPSAPFVPAGPCVPAVLRVPVVPQVPVGPQVLAGLLEPDGKIVSSGPLVPVGPCVLVGPRVLVGL